MSSIGELSQGTEVKIETIRYYEKIGLIPAPSRTSGGHRIYNTHHKERLLFVRRSRELGFSLEEVRELISLSENQENSCGDALSLVTRHLESVDEKLRQLQLIQQSLELMAKDCQSCCPGARAPDCTIIEALSDCGPASVP